MWKTKKMVAKPGKKGLIIILVLIFFSFAFLKSFYKFVSIKIKERQMIEEIEILKQKNDEIKRKLNNIYDNKDFIEKQARQLNLIKDGEIVFIIKKTE